MGLHAVPTTSAFYDQARIEADRLIGADGQGLQIAFSALDSGRLGIAAVAVGWRRLRWTRRRVTRMSETTFGRKIIDHQGLGFLLADMAAAVASARATYLDAARRRDLGRRIHSRPASPSWSATDAAMKVTTDAVQVFGGVGYTRDFRVERYMREGEDHPDLRGHKPDSAFGHRSGTVRLTVRADAKAPDTPRELGPLRLLAQRVDRLRR